ncbi:MAG: hypothetical protein QOC96_1923 [Acidobacteriota bacterium]|jgi:hypothetical protein|nr:hypothetical protein [Acidobacteriota bacterium]
MSHQNTTPSQPTEFPVRRTEIKTWLTEETMSPLGRELMKIAREVEASDEPALDEEDIEKELKRRRGGYANDGE